MRRQMVRLSFLLALGAGCAAAQANPPAPGTVPNPHDVYCSGMVTTEAVPSDTYLISGEEADPQMTFNEGNYVYVNKGASQGVKVGDEFLIMRAEKEYVPQTWFKTQPAMRRTMGTQWKDLGRVRVVVAGQDVATARVIYSCDYIQRGDIALPAVERAVPPLKSAKGFDRFAPPSGKPVGLIVSNKDFASVVGANDIVYVSLSAAEGAKVGDFVRIYRTEGMPSWSIYQVRNPQDRMHGFGKSPLPYLPANLPREVLGEGVILRTTPQAVTVFIIHSLREVYMGDYAEIE
jgi:hypothetical protein